METSQHQSESLSRRSWGCYEGRNGHSQCSFSIFVHNTNMRCVKITNVVTQHCWIIGFQVVTSGHFFGNIFIYSLRIIKGGLMVRGNVERGNFECGTNTKTITEAFWYLSELIKAVCS